MVGEQLNVIHAIAAAEHHFRTRLSTSVPLSQNDLLAEIGDFLYFSEQFGAEEQKLFIETVAHILAVSTVRMLISLGEDTEEAVSILEIRKQFMAESTVLKLFTELEDFAEQLYSLCDRYLVECYLYLDESIDSDKFIKECERSILYMITSSAKSVLPRNLNRHCRNY